MMAQIQMLIKLLLFVYLVDGITVTTKYSSSRNTLQLLHVVFRHGDRTQDGSYPNDPYQNETFYPVGEGQLTNAGKVRAYNIGLYLRDTYNGFLPSVYSPGIIQALSSSIPRCKASLQLVFASLFLPAEIQKWNPFLNWQPIPYDYLPMSENMYFFSFSNCPSYWTFYNDYKNTTTYQENYTPYKRVLRYLEKNSGIIASPFPPTILLHSTLKSQEEWGLTLPDWTDPVWPEPITTLTKIDWQQLFATKETRALGAGFLLSKIINDTQLTLNKDPSVNGLKAYLYSAHDLNIAAVLSWLGTPDLHIPEYGSFIIFEIHTISGVPHIRIIHQNYEHDTPQVIKIPNCGFYCPFYKFIKLYFEYTNPTDLCY